MAKSVKRIAFSDEKLFTLIELYRENECLWDIRSPVYKNTLKRKAAFTNIAEKLELDEKPIKKKITSIRAIYLLEKKKITENQRTGSSTDDVYIPIVPWFDHMKFLNDVIIPRKTISNLDSLQSQLAQSEEPNEVSRKNDLSSATKFELTKSAASTITPTIQFKKKKANLQGLHSAQNAIDIAINKLTKINDQDMFDNFGNLIASQLKTIPVEDALQLQQNISEMVNNRLLQVHRCSCTPPSDSSRPSSFSSHIADVYEDIRSPSSAVLLDLNKSETENESHDSTTDIISRALHGIME